ncbi:MAG: ribonuclease P protein component [Bacteroidales bacterium]|jgi:ribonuclease P protein component|nr:ribonuclease P protein component [Bacteroidales bacterium]
MHFSFSKKEHLCSDKAISALFAKGRRFSRTVKGNTLRCVYLVDVDVPVSAPADAIATTATAPPAVSASSSAHVSAPAVAAVADMTADTATAPATVTTTTTAAATTKVPAKILISVPKKNMKKAISRNRIKRLIREAYRLQKNILLSSNMRFNIAFVYQGSANIPFEDVKNIIGFFLEKILSDETRS